MGADMADNRNQDYGQQFNKAIKDALGDGNFEGLNRLVEDALETTITGAIDQIKRFQSSASKDTFHASNSSTSVPNRSFVESQAKKQYTYGNQNTYQTNGANSTPNFQRQAVGSYYMPYTNAKPQAYNNPLAVKLKNSPLFKKIGNVSGTLFQVFGGIGTGIFGLLFVIFGMIDLFSGAGRFLAVDICMASLTALSILMITKGSDNKTKSARSERYYRMCEKTGYCNISDLARAVAKDEKFVLKDLKKMLAKGVFPQGHIDDEEKCFMITDAAYEEYRKVTAERKAQALSDLSQKNTASGEELTEQAKQLREMIAEGREYISLIRQKNDAIPGEVFSQKLYRMEDLLKEIFLNLEKKPNQMSKMHRLMNYYLPTTLKLVSAYEEFDKMSVQGDDVANAKKEIENTVDTINDAFGEILNKLFSDTAMDVTTDAQVLKTILAREGLTKDNLTINNNKEENEYVYELR